MSVFAPSQLTNGLIRQGKTTSSGIILESDYANGTMWTIENSLIKIERKQLRRERQLKLGTQKNGRKQLKLKIDKANKYKNFL